MTYLLSDSAFAWMCRGMDCCLLRVILTLLNLGLVLNACGFALCGPMYLDPTTFGGKHAGEDPVDRFCTTTSLRVEGGWNDVNYAKGWRPLEHLEWFGAHGKGEQVCCVPL